MSTDNSSRSPKITEIQLQGKAIGWIFLLMISVLVPFWLIGCWFLAVYPPPATGKGALAEAAQRVGVDATNDDAGLGDVSGKSGDAAIARSPDQPNESRSTDRPSNSIPADKPNTALPTGASNSNSKVAKSPDGTDQSPNDDALSSSPLGDEEFIKKQIEARFKNEIKKLEMQVTSLQDQLRAQTDQMKSHASELQKKDDEIANLSRRIESVEDKAIQPSANTSPPSTVKPGDQPASDVGPAETDLPPNPDNQNLPSKYPFREWTSSDGTKATLAFVRWEGNEIIVVDRQNLAYKIAIERLSEEDQSYVQSLKK